MNPDQECARVDALLPWFVNRSLDDVERRDVERHLEACERCRHELPLLLRMQEAFTASDVEIVAEDSFREVIARIDADTHRKQVRSRQYAMAAAVTLALAVTLGTLLQQQYFSPRYQTVTDAVPAADHVVMFELRFEPEARLASLRGVLEDYDAVIVGGPDERGHVRLQFALSSPGQADALLERLRVDTRVAAVRPASAAAGSAR